MILATLINANGKTPETSVTATEVIGLAMLPEMHVSSPMVVDGKLKVVINWMVTVTSTPRPEKPAEGEEQAQVQVMPPQLIVYLVDPEKAIFRPPLVHGGPTLLEQLKQKQKMI